MEKSIKKYFPIFALPTLVAFTIGFIVPFLMGIYLSFCEFTTVTDASFVGLKNYLRVFTDPTFVHALWYTALFTVVSVITINVFAFTIAMLLTKGIRGTNVFRTVFFMPNLIGGIVLGYIWQILLNGILANFGKTLTYSSSYGFWGLIVLMNWQQIGYMMIIYIAGLQNVSDDLIEAAAIDGCGIYGCFFRIALPLCRTGFFVSGLMTFVGNWNELLMAMVFVSDPAKKTLPVTLTYFVGPYATNYVQMFAAIIIAIAPTVIVYCLFSNQIVEGLTTGAVKR